MTQVVELSSLLVSKPGYRDGRPCLRGTGITVHTVAAHYMQGLTAEQMAEDNPGLDASALHAAVAYYLANKERVEAELEQDAIEGERLAAQSVNGFAVRPD